jgi:hypothetical protein
LEVSTILAHRSLSRCFDVPSITTLSFILFERGFFQASKCKSKLFDVQMVQNTKAASLMCACAHRSMSMSFSRNPARREPSMYILYRT